VIWVYCCNVIWGKLQQRDLWSLLQQCDRTIALVHTVLRMCFTITPVHAVATCTTTLPSGHGGCLIHGNERDIKT
jgi:hypothetical protein